MWPCTCPFLQAPNDILRLIFVNCSVSADQHLHTDIPKTDLWSLLQATVYSWPKFYEFTYWTSLEQQSNNCKKNYCAHAAKFKFKLFNSNRKSYTLNQQFLKLYTPEMMHIPSTPLLRANSKTKFRGSWTLNWGQSGTS